MWTFGYQILVKTGQHKSAAALTLEMIASFAAMLSLGLAAVSLVSR